MDVAERARALETEGRRLIEVTSVDLDADVPTCPGWQAADLLRHVAGGWEAFRSIIEAASTEPPDFGAFAAAPEDNEGLSAFAAARLELLVAAVGGADPQRAVWTWNGVKPMDFYPRRSHFETVVHRVDAELATGACTPIDPSVGIDGVDELFTEFLAGRSGELPTGSFHLHQTDGGGEFMLDVVEGVLTVSHEHAKGDAALRATGEDLLLVMWGRRGLDGLELFGDRAVAEQWMALSP
jgi:uncharacterized protein (TIGR03083 family)